MMGRLGYWMIGILDDWVKINPPPYPPPKGDTGRLVRKKWHPLPRVPVDEKIGVI